MGWMKSRTEGAAVNASKIDRFIEARLVEAETRIRTGMVSINGINMTRHVERDIKATRKLLKIAARLEGWSNDPESELQRCADDVRRVVAARWSDHRDFEEQWLPLG